MAEKELNFNIRTNIKSAAKDAEILQAKLENTKRETKELTNNFGAFGVTVGGVKEKFKTMRKIMANGLKQIGLQARIAGKGMLMMFDGKMKVGAKVLFGAIKSGIAATGIGLLVIAFGSLVQYFKDSEIGASKFKQITSQLGVVVGNVTDIISDLGKAVFKLIKGDFDGFKEGLADVTQGVKDFGETTRKEMGQANQLEKDRLALQIFEREAIVEKARTEKDMMELRLKARDFEKFSAEERLGFMRLANKLAAEQLEKDMHVAKEKLRFQVEENSYSKSTQQNLDDEAALQAAVFNLERANFSERKRMKSEEQAIVKELQAANKAITDAEIKAAADKIEADQKAMDAENKRKSDEYDLLEALRVENMLAEIEDLQEKALKELEIQKESELAKLESYENFEQLKAEIDEKYKNKADKVNQSFKKKELKWEEMTQDQKLGVASSAAGNMAKIMGEETEAGKALAVVQATIDTYRGATAAYASLAGVGPVGPALGAIAAAAAIASGLANVKAIMSADSSGGGASLSTPSATATTPSPQIASGAFTLEGGIEPEPARAYVVSDDITNSQNKLANIRRRATI